MKGQFETVGVGFGGDLTCSELVRLAVLAEELKFQSLWIQEGDQRSCIVHSAVVLHATKRLLVGTGITSPFRRHPQTLAIETATLNELSNNRFILGLGAAERLIRGYRILNGEPIVAIRDAFAIIRGIFSEDNLTYEGEVFAFKMRQKRLKPKPQIYMGAIGSKMLDLVGELADGLLITRRGAFASNYTKYAIDRVCARAKTVGRDPSKINFLGFFETSLSKKRDKAREFAKKILATYTIPNTPQIVLDLAGISSTEIEKVKVNYLKGNFGEAVKYVNDDLVDKFALAGTPDECLEKILQYVDTGLKCPILYIHGPDQKVAAKLAAEEITPNLLKR